MPMSAMEERAPLTPHEQDFEKIMRRKAGSLHGKRVHFTCLPGIRIGRVTGVSPEGMVTVERCAGEFAPHLFQVSRRRRRADAGKSRARPFPAPR
jgi:hypothetical protein